MTRGAASRNILLCACALALAFITFPPRARAGDFETRQKAFIRLLFERHDYFSAAAETRRLLEYTPGGPRDAAYRYFIEANYFLGGQRMSVISHIAGNPVMRDPGSLLLLSRAYFAQGMYVECGAALDELSPLSLDDGTRMELALRRAELSLTRGRFDEALGGVRAALPSFTRPEALGALARDLEAAGPLPYRSPALAAIFSAALPGSGQVYAGRRLDGLISLFATAVLSYGTWRAHDAGQKGAAFTLGFFTGLVYAGNVYGGWNAARNRARDAEASRAAELIDRHIPAFDPLGRMDYRRLLEYYE